jgi:hypothetical protein
MGIPIATLDDYTPHEFRLYQQGHQEREESQWQQTRFVAWMVQAVASEKPLTVEEVLPLPSDEKRKKQIQEADSVKKVSAKQLDKINSLFD